MRIAVLIVFFLMQNVVVAQRDYYISFIKNYTQEFDPKPSINRNTHTVRIIGDFVAPTLSLTKRIDTVNYLRFAITYHKTGYSPYKSGRYLERNFIAFQSDFIGNIYSSNFSKSELNYFVGLKARFGEDIVFIEPWPVLTQYPTRRLQDFSIHSGLQQVWHFKKNFWLSIESGVTYWPILYHNLTNSSTQNKIARFSLDGRLSIGYGLTKYRGKTRYDSERQRKNSINLQYHLPIFLFEKGSRKLSSQVKRNIGRRSFQATYSRNIHEKWNIDGMLALWEIEYTDSKFGTDFRAAAKQGTVSYREAVIVGLGLSRLLTQRDERLQVSIPFAFNFRYGKEYFIAENVVNVDGQYDLRDIGLIIGINSSFQLNHSLSIQANIAYNKYVFIYSKYFENPPQRSILWPEAKGASSNIITLSTGLKYNF